MENQVQQLEELLARVKRNRARMATKSGAAGGRLVAPTVAMADTTPTAEADSAESDVDSEAAVIDLVHPTNPPDSPVMLKSEDDFSSVAPVSVAPATAAMDDEADEAEISEALPPSMAPAEPIASVAEDDFSSVAPVSIAPEAPQVPEKSATAVAKVELVSMAIPPSMLPNAEPSPSLSTPEDADDSDELEIVNSDTASMNPGMPYEAASYAVGEGEEDEQQPSAEVVTPGKEKLENRTFQQSALASAEVVAVRNNLPKQKSYTINAVLHRAWQLGKNA